MGGTGTDWSEVGVARIVDSYTIPVQVDAKPCVVMDQIATDCIPYGSMTVVTDYHDPG